LQLKLCLLLAIAQGLCWLMARGLQVRLPPRVMAFGFALPLVFLSPFLAADDLVLAPTGVLDHVVPAIGQPPAVISHLVQSDAMFEILPWELDVRAAYHAHRLPFWSDRMSGGSSPWINLLAGALSPLALLARALPIQHFLLAMLALKLLVACEGAWVLARQVGVSRASSWLVAAGFTLGGGMLSWGLFPQTTVLAWAPWLTLGCIRVFRRPRPRFVAVTAAITAVLLLSGHPEMAAASGLLAAVCGLGLHRRRTGLWRGLLAAGGAALLGFALAAPQVVPLLRALPAAQRTRDVLAQPRPAYDARASVPRSWFVPGTAAFVAAPVNPRVYGVPYVEPFRGPEDWVDALSGYTGLVAFAGAVVAWLGWRARRSRRAWPWLGFAGLSLLLAAGFVPLVAAIQRVPLLRLPAYTRLLPVASLALAVAGGFGTDLLLRWRRLAARDRVRAAVALGVAAALSLAAERSGYVLMLWGLLAGAVWLARWRRQAAVAVLALALALDLLPWAERLLPRGQPGLFYPPNGLTAMLARETRAGQDGRDGRAVSLDRMQYPSLLPAYGIAEVRTNDVMVSAAYLRVLQDAFHFAPTMDNYYADFVTADHPMLSFLDVRAVVGNVWRPRPRGLQAIDDPRILPFLVFRNPGALPRWFLPAGVEVVDRGAIDAWIAGMRDAGRVALLRDEVAALGSTPAPLPLQSRVVVAARVLAAAPGWTRLAVPGSGERLLATSQPGPAGWRASGGGRRLAELTVNGAFLGVVVPAGVEWVELRYLPPGLLPGAALCVLGLCVVAVLVVADRGRRWPHPAGRAPR
jgi:hypothetical protein